MKLTNCILTAEVNGTRQVIHDVVDAGGKIIAALPVPSSAPQSSSDGPANGCKIKGNINSKGEKIYHVPGGQYYESTQIDLPQGERWFCNERQAKDAGWRAAQ